VVGAVASGYFAYQAYDYVEHDNNFCFSCHLMAEPYELFAQSAHRGLGCKACHQPNLLERSQMGVTGIVFDPDTLSAHAEVPNQLCAACHIEGDPERWRLIAESAGHRVHLESDDPAFGGLLCVECHSSSLHEFTAVDQTCSQSGCHTESGIELAGMSNLTIHCAACHAFSAPVGEETTALAALAPDEGTCLGCHAMRTVVEMPDPDPHGGSCASCHNPHEQSTPAEAAGSCTGAGCHEDIADLSPFHVGVDSVVVEDCLYCHVAHDFELDGDDCLACHQDVLAPIPGVGSAVPVSPAMGAGALAPGVGMLHAVASRAGSSQAAPFQEAAFDHRQHVEVPCASCHDSSERHGETVVRTQADCRSCHHSADEPIEGGCATCHVASEIPDDPHAVTQTFTVSAASAPVTRALPLEHATHADVTCSSCHVEGPDQSAEAVDCASCHEEHHEPAMKCASCHVTEAGGPHRI
jgi:nitrate/TMAO reductase-like tetraheme cytochrome c subunit